MKTVAVVVSMLWAALAAAQPAVPTAVVLHTYRASDPVTGPFFTELVLPWAGFLCNQAVLAVPVLPWVNVTTFDFDDPTRVGRKCRVTAATVPTVAAFFAALPTASGYQVTFTYQWEGGVTEASPVNGPFRRTAGTPCGVNLAGRTASVALTTGNVTLCIEPR